MKFGVVVRKKKQLLDVAGLHMNTCHKIVADVHDSLVRMVFTLFFSTILYESRHPPTPRSLSF
jgi:hypothetical protein